MDKSRISGCDLPLAGDEKMPHVPSQELSCNRTAVWNHVDLIFLRVSNIWL